MNAKSSVCLIAFLLGSFLTPAVFGQSQGQVTNILAVAPKTKLEAFHAKTGALLTFGSTKVGTVYGPYNSWVTVDCKEFVDAASGKREYGLTVTTDQSPFSYVDYDEIAPLISGISAMAKIDKSTTKLASFRTVYQTKGDLAVEVTNQAEGKITAAIRSGGELGTAASLTLGNLDDVARLISKAKGILDDAKR